MAEQIQSLRRPVVETKEKRKQRLARNARATAQEEAAADALPNVAPLAQGYYARRNAKLKGALQSPPGTSLRNRRG